MKNPIIIISVLLILAVFAGACSYLTQSNNSDAMKKDDRMVKTTDTTTAETMAKNESMEKNAKEMVTMEMSDEKMADKSNSDEMMMKGEEGKYLEFEPAVLDQTKAMKRVLFFYASWCPTCKPTDAEFKANESNLPRDLALIRVNYNDPETSAEEKALAQKYGVTYQHTFVQIDNAGNVLTKWNGGKLAELQKNLK